VRLSLNVEDRVAVVDGTPVELSVLRSVPAGVRAVQVYANGTVELEFSDGRLNETWSGAKASNLAFALKQDVDASVLKNEERKLELAAAYDASWARVLAEKLGALGSTDFLVLRHLEQRERGAELALSEAQFQSLLEWRQAVRDLPTSGTDAGSVRVPVWEATGAD
jgi:hypothetical protein